MASAIFRTFFILGAALVTRTSRTPTVQERSAQDSQKRIAALEQTYQTTTDRAVIGAIARNIDREVDVIIRKDFDSASGARLDAADVASRLQRILGDTSEHSGTAFMGGRTDHRYLIVAYCVCGGALMGPDATSVTVRAYNQTATGLVLADATGQNMNGFADLVIKEVHAGAAEPVAGAPRSTFVLLSGYMTGANGPVNRMRIYAFDGHRFRPVWMPADVWGRFDVQVSADRFTVDGDYYRQDRKRHDTYAVSEDGVRLIAPVVR